MRQTINKLLIQYPLALIYPPRCPVCHEPAPFTRLICPECENYFKLIAEPRCMKCGKQLKDENEQFCLDCKKRRHYFEAGRALYDYNTVSDAIYKFKFEGRREYAVYFGQQLALKLGKTINRWDPHIIIAVPLHKSKLKQRGFNQSALLARELSKSIKIPYVENVVLRKRKTVPMKLLSGAERQINLKNAFIVGQYDVKLKRILIVDDIYTTGSTIDEMTRVLLAAGAEKVYFITLSIGRGL